MAENILEWEDSFKDSDEQGMYGTGNDSYIEYLGAEDDELESLLMSGDTSSVYPEISAVDGANEEDNPFFNVNEDGKAQILGIPFSFNKLSDPDGRVFRQTIMTDLPMVFVVPGKTVLNNKLITDDGKKIGKGKLLTLLTNNATDLLNFAVKGARSGTDLRFLGFKADYSEYFRYVQTALSIVHATMGLSGTYNFADSFDEGGKGLNGVRNHGLCFYMDKSSSISEGNSNDYTQTSVAQRANDLNAINRESKMMLGINPDEDSGMVSKALDFVTESISTLSEGVTSLTGILSRAGNIFGRIVNGSQLLYPEIWTDSTLDKSYTLNFKFYSPYADKESIFEYVYVPFMCWVILSYPRQDNVMGYGQPFVMRLSCPGWFDSSLAVVQSISFTKGGDDNNWTIDNLPLQIDVNVTIKDLYSSMPITKKYKMMSYNMGLSSFLDTMSGIRTDQLSLFNRTKTWVKSRLSIPSRWFNSSIKGNLSDFGYNIQQKVSQFIK